MNKLVDKINYAINNNKTLLMGHIVAGFPDFQTSLEAASGISCGGASIIEVQFPFSDPCADGPTIENASFKAIQNGFKVKDGFKIVKFLNEKTESAIIIVTYANILYRYGIEKFVREAKESGAQAILVPDLIPENDEGLKKIANNYGLGVVFIANFGATKERIKYISEMSDCFLYVVSRRGITGDKTTIENETIEWLKFVSENSTKPISVGFGIQSKEQINIVKKYSPIVVVGSHFVKIIEKLSTDDNVFDILKSETEKLCV